MEDELLKKMRRDAKDIFEESIRSVQPYDAVRKFMRLEGEKLRLGAEGDKCEILDLKKYRRVRLVGGGKATAGIVNALLKKIEKTVETSDIDVEVKNRFLRNLHGFVEGVQRLWISGVKM